MGLRVIPVPYLENKYSVSVAEKIVDDKTVWEDITVDLSEPHAILIHKNVFPYKFSDPMFATDKIPGAFVNIFDLMVYYPKDWKSQKQKDGHPGAYILPKFCVGFNFDIKFEELDSKPDKDHLPNGWAREKYENITLAYKQRTININGVACWRASESWANAEHGIEGNHKNWFEWAKEFGDEDKWKNITFSSLVLWTTTSWGSKYCVPVLWEVKKLKENKNNKKDNNLMDL